MNQQARKRYTPEFKAQAVERLDTGKPVSQVAEELCISSNLLYKSSALSHFAIEFEDRMPNKL